jgi:hypothetical protein
LPLTASEGTLFIFHDKAIKKTEKDFTNTIQVYAQEQELSITMQDKIISN